MKKSNKTLLKEINTERKKLEKATKTYNKVFAANQRQILKNLYAQQKQALAFSSNYNHLCFLETLKNIVANPICFRAPGYKIIEEVEKHLSPFGLTIGKEYNDDGDEMKYATVKNYYISQLLWTSRKPSLF